MKTFITLVLSLITSVGYTAELCQETVKVEIKDVTYRVDKYMAQYLKGATITVKLADGRESTVPAEKFMVVPRKQQTVVGQSTATNRNLTCSSSKKNILMGEVRKDVTHLDTETKAVPNGAEVRTYANKGLVPGVNYYRRELFDSPVGAGVGIDANGTVKGLVGVDF